MTKIDLGRITPTYRGYYDSTVSYNELDIVYDDTIGKSFIAKQASKGKDLPVDKENEYWGIIAKQGPKGTPGEVGPKGDQGIQGERGPKGDRGDQGPRWLQGIQGDQGVAGPKGDKGDTGPQGPSGDTKKYDLWGEDYDLVGDGVTDNAENLNKLFLDGSTIYDRTGIRPTIHLSKGKYLIKGWLIFQSNIDVILDNECIIYGPGQLFTFRSFGKGYGNGVSNVSVTGGTFSGDYELYDSVGGMSYSGAFCGSLHHAENLVFKDVTFNMTTSNSHTLDMGGVRNVVIDSCKFYGIYNPNIANREYVEAIQIDYSNAVALTGKTAEELANVDGTVSHDIKIKNCLFSAIYNGDGGIKYYGPNVGEHGVMSSGMPYNIEIDNNTFIDCNVYNKNAFVNGWVHFIGVDNLSITNNKFINTTGHFSRAIGIDTRTTKLKDPITGEATDLYAYSDNILIDNNKIEGFTNETDASGIVLIKGNVNNIKDKAVFSNNNSYNNIPETISRTNPRAGSRGSDFLRPAFFNRIEINDNSFVKLSRAVYIAPTYTTTPTTNPTVIFNRNYIKDIPYGVFVSSYDFGSGNTPTNNLIISDNYSMDTNVFLYEKLANNLEFTNNYLQGYSDIELDTINYYSTGFIKLRNIVGNVNLSSNRIMLGTNLYSSGILIVDDKQLASNKLITLNNITNKSLLGSNAKTSIYLPDISNNQGAVFSMLGDSYVKGNKTDESKVAYSISAGTLNMIYHNLGVNGSTVAKYDAYTKEPMVIRYKSINPSSEIIGVEGGRNDYNHNIPIGQDNDNKDNTFIGALNIIFGGLIQNFPNAKLFAVPCWAVSTTPNEAGHTQLDYLNAMVHVARDLWGIPVLDSREVNVHMNSKAFLTNFTEGGNSISHLNEQGHINFSKYVTKFLINL